LQTAFVAPTAVALDATAFEDWFNVLAEHDRALRWRRQRLDLFRGQLCTGSAGKHQPKRDTQGMTIPFHVRHKIYVELTGCASKAAALLRRAM
jgi:hypothetical protein